MAPPGPADPRRIAPGAARQHARPGAPRPVGGPTIPEGLPCAVERGKSDLDAGRLHAVHRPEKTFVLVAMFSVVLIGGYAISTLTGMLSSDIVMAYRENRSMERILDRLANHIVVIGFGAIGRLVAGQLKSAGTA